MTSKPLPKVCIKAENLSVAYGSYEALNIASLVAEGSVIAIVGHNGSGKSTMIKTLLDLLVPRCGAIGCFELGERGERLLPERHMAFSPEEGAVFGDLSVESYIRLWCQLKQNNPNYYKQDGSSYIDKFELVPLLGKTGRALSKGQRRRVQTAIGFLTKPRVFLFDEPFDGLDIQQSSQFARIIHSEASEISMVVSSHRMEVVERLADCVIVLKNGRVEAVGSIDEVCRVLCGTSVMISADNGAAEALIQMLPLMELRYPKCLVNRIGSAVTIVGRQADAADVSEFLNAQIKQGVHVSQCKPSLVDAMDYHLRQF